MLRYCLLLLTLVIVGIRTESVEEDYGEQYFGVPLGALHFSSDGTSAEIYAADEFTIIFNHFYHNPRQLGCTSMMLGPPRNEDNENVIDGHGVLIASAHAPVAARHRHRHRREADGFDSPLERFRSWPLEFDHLLMSSSSGSEKSAAVPLPKVRSNEGNDGSPKVGVNRLERINVRKPKNNSDDALISSIRSLEAEAENAFGRSSSNESGEGKSAQTTAAFPTLVTITSRPKVDKTHATTLASSTIKSTIIIEKNKQQEVKPLILFDTKSKDQQATQRPRAQRTTSGNNPSSSNERSGVVVTSSGETYAIGSGSTDENFQRSVQQSGGKSLDFVRRAPAVSGLENFDISSQEDKWGNIDSKRAPAPTKAPAHAQTLSTASFWVISDPRESRRQRLLELRKKVNDPMSTTTTTTQAPEQSPKFDERFTLPRIRDKLATFSLTNGAKINNYKWIGIYDQCLRRHIPLVTLRDVDPPREEKIMPLSGWSHNVTSYRVHILNCNTILVPGFSYDGTNTSSSTYFFVGVGQFPNSIERQMKVMVVGTKKNEPLRDYNGEDVLLRLPRGFRTFDVDYISVFNVDEQKSYAHVIIPSLLVPPCSDD